MKLKLLFGTDELSYAWFQQISDFPYLVLFKGKKWEFIFHNEDDQNQFDRIFYFAQVKSYDPNWYATVYHDLDKEIYSRLTCECGSDKHGFAGHAQWCPKWVNLNP